MEQFLYFNFVFFKRTSSVLCMCHGYVYRVFNILYINTYNKSYMIIYIDGGNILASYIIYKNQNKFITLTTETIYEIGGDGDI